MTPLLTPALSQSELTLVAGAALIALAMLCAATLRGWERWLALRAREIDALTQGPGPHTPIAGRIELADLRERVRQLEAIAAGVEL